MILEREAYRRGDRARRHMVRPTEGRQEIKEHFLVCEIDDTGDGNGEPTDPVKFLSRSALWDSHPILLAPPDADSVGAALMCARAYMMVFL
jgi:hypothetical protein